MNNHQQKNNRNYKLGDLILAVRACSKNNRETLAVIADLIESGHVRFQLKGGNIRARIC